MAHASAPPRSTLACVAVGAAGTFSVLSNAMPVEVVELVRLVRAGRHADARAMALRLAPYVAACQLDSNPVPLKR